MWCSRPKSSVIADFIGHVGRGTSNESNFQDDSRFLLGPKHVETPTFSNRSCRTENGEEPLLLRHAHGSRVLCFLLPPHWKPGELACLMAAVVACRPVRQQGYPTSIWWNPCTHHQNNWCPEIRSCRSNSVQDQISTPLVQYWDARILQLSTATLGDLA
jgi:hypothetical protein